MIFFALIFSGLRGCFFKNGVFAYKMKISELFIFSPQDSLYLFCVNRAKKDTS